MVVVGKHQRGRVMAIFSKTFVVIFLLASVGYAVAFDNGVASIEKTEGLLKARHAQLEMALNQ